MDMENNRRVKVVISGKVQGVFFRVETKKAADRFNIYGWVKNLKDSTVSAVFEGEYENVDKMLNWCSQGSLLSEVDNVSVSIEQDKGEFLDFQIFY